MEPRTSKPGTSEAEPDRRQALADLAALIAWPTCCRTAEAPAGSFRYEGARLILDLSRTPALRKPGAAVALVDTARALNVIVAHVDGQHYVTLDRTCTHGGAMCAYSAKRHTLQCTSLNHAEYDLQGTLLHGRTHGNLKAYATRRTGTSLVIELERPA